MAFKLLYENTASPQGDFLVDPNLLAEAGMLGVVSGTTTGSPTGLPYVVLGFSGATGLVGIIDENKNTQFLATVNGEVVVSGQTTAAHANIVSATFAASGTGIAINSAANGTYTNTNTGTSFINYSYVIPGKAGDDTTLGSGKCTLWLQNGEFATDIYETLGTDGSTVLAYTVNAALYCSGNGKLTIATGSAPAAWTKIGYVTKAPSAANPFLNFYKTLS
jgi:hypothetical protein